MISIPGLLQRSARLNPDAVATRYNGRSRHWPQVLDRVATFAGALDRLQLGEAERVAILSLNSDNYFEAIFAVPWAGYCMVPLNTRWAVAENNYALTDSGTRVLLFDDAFSAQAEQLKNEVESLEHVIYMGDGETPNWAKSYESLIADNQTIAPSTRNGADMAGIFYTGGTTGFPKGVMQSHQAIWASAIGGMGGMEIDSNGSYLHTAPMFHMADFACSMMTVLAGASHIFVAGFEPALVLNIIAEEKISHVLMVPAMIKMALAHENAATADLSSLQRILYGASPMPAALLTQAMDLWPTVGFIQAYGQTELAPLVTMLSTEDHRRGGEILKSAGKPLSVSEIKLLNDAGDEVDLGKQGEVVVRGPHAMIGYWNKPEETASALQDGWVFTGDAGIFDKEGYLYIVDRVKDMVVTGGENVFTTEVENALISHAAVQDVAVIGVPHEEWGEAVHGIVILAAGATATEKELIEHCRSAIAGYKCPKTVEFRDQPMPLSGAGKVLKTELRKPHWEGRERQVN